MPAHAHDPWDEPAPRPLSEGRFSLQAVLDRQFEEFADGPSMADILADLDQYRRPDGPTTDEIVDALHETRQEREDHLGGLWQK